METAAPATISDLSSVFHALGHPARLEIVALVSRRDHTVLELAGRFDMSQPAVTKHLAVLEDAGLIIRLKDGRFRRCRVRHEPIETAKTWMETIERYWNEQLDRLEEVLREERDVET